MCFVAAMLPIQLNYRGFTLKGFELGYEDCVGCLADL